jgi:hypothetical protein
VVEVFPALVVVANSTNRMRRGRRVTYKVLVILRLVVVVVEEVVEVEAAASSIQTLKVARFRI